MRPWKAYHGKHRTLSRMIPWLLMPVINCSALGGEITVSVCSLRSSFVTVIVFEVVTFCCFVVGFFFSKSEAQLRYTCARFSADLKIFFLNGGMILIVIFDQNVSKRKFGFEFLL